MLRSKTKEAQSRRHKTYAQEWIDSTTEPKQKEEIDELESQHEQGLATRLYFACLQTFREICHDAAQAASVYTQKSVPAISEKSVKMLPESDDGRFFACHDCDKVFVTESYLENHICSHRKTRLTSSSREKTRRYPNHPPPPVTSMATTDQLCTLSVAKDQMVRFFLWGEGFSNGRLDIALGQSDELRNTVLELLCDVAVELRKGKWLQQSRSQAKYATEAVIEMDLLVDQSKAVVERDAVESVQGYKDNVSAISSLTSPDKYSESEAPEVGDGLDSIIQSLMDLASTIENTLIQAENKNIVATQTNVSSFNVSQPAQTYVSHVRDKFRKAPTRLIERLGEANWQRHVVLRAKVNQEGSVLEDKETILAAFQPKSMFHDSGLGTTVTASSHYAASMASHSSFLSSVTGRELGTVKVPPTPPEISACKPFTCFLCGHVQKKLRNRVDWKMHVFVDLQPYICTSSMCSQELLQFSTRKAWAEHEFTEHHKLRVWSCSECTAEYIDLEKLREHLQTSHTNILSPAEVSAAIELAPRDREKPIGESPCPLCLSSTGNSRREYVKHVGRHMEEIALMVLPKEDVSLDESSNEESEHVSKDNNNPMKIVNEKSANQQSRTVLSGEESLEKNYLNENSGISRRSEFTDLTDFQPSIPAREKPFRCDRCTSSFTHSGGLRRHQRENCPPPFREAITTADSFPILQYRSSDFFDALDIKQKDRDEANELPKSAPTA